MFVSCARRAPLARARDACRRRRPGVHLLRHVRRHVQKHVELFWCLRSHHFWQNHRLPIRPCWHSVLSC